MRGLWPLLAVPAATLTMLAGMHSVASAAPPPRFVESAAKRGLNFRHVSPQSAPRHVHLTMGSGVGWVDFDRDGWPDLYLAQGTPWQGTTEPPASGPSDALYRNVGGQFHDVSSAARIVDRSYSMGVSIGDVDADGFLDISLTNFGSNVFFYNNGDGTFTESAAERGMAGKGYGASCTWTDVDADGALDLFVVNYLAIDPADYKTCHDQSAEKTGLPIACPPWAYTGQPDVLYRGAGDGSFLDVSESNGLVAAEPRQGLGVVTIDVDEDGDLDLFVANDSVPNHLWINDGRGVFEERAELAGAALNAAGQRQAGMGVAAGDADGDGRPDLFITNYYEETNTLYRNEGAGFFWDVTDAVGLGAPSRARLGFGTLFLDAENDGDLDLFVANGHIHDRLKSLGRDIPYRQPAQLYVGEKGRYVDGSADAGEFFAQPLLGRGAAAADFNRDGRPDVALCNLDLPVSLLENESMGGHALSLQLIGRRTNRDGIGARIEITAGGRKQVLFRDGSTSYLSCSDGIVLAGIGEEMAADVAVTWLGGAVDTWPGVPAGRVVRLVEGRGTGEAP